MKKIAIFISMIIMCMAFTNGFAQTSFNHTIGNVKDSIKDNGIDTLSYTTSHSYPLITIQTIVTKATGTMAGTSILSQSVDGINYVNVDTLTLANATTNTAVFSNQSAARYWRIITGGATTVTATVKAYISAPY